MFNKNFNMILSKRLTNNFTIEGLINLNNTAEGNYANNYWNTSNGNINYNDNTQGFGMMYGNDCDVMTSTTYTLNSDKLYTKAALSVESKGISVGNSGFALTHIVQNITDNDVKISDVYLTASPMDVGGRKFLLGGIKLEENKVITLKPGEKIPVTFNIEV